MAPFASLKVKGEDKRLFDRLLHEVALQSGESVSQHELFHRILALALASKRDLVRPRRGPTRRDWTRYPFDLGERTDASRDLDRVVYGL